MFKEDAKNPQLSAAAIALLFGAAKMGLIGTIGFAIAWFRARARIQKLESTTMHRFGPGWDERIDRIEQTVDYMAGQFDRIVEAHERSPQQLPPSQQDRWRLLRYGAPRADVVPFENVT